MNHFLPMLALVCGVLVANPVVAAAQDIDVSGDWSVTFQTPQGPQTFPVTLAQDGNSVTGKAMVMEGNEFELTGGTLEGAELTFEFPVDLGGGPFTLVFTGTVDGDTIEGSVTSPAGQALPFTAEREGG